MTTDAIPHSLFAALERCAITPPLMDAARQVFLRHGDNNRWHTALAQLPDCADSYNFQDSAIQLVGHSDHAFDALQSLRPWRKGPFDLFGVPIDAEWRSDLKFARLQSAVSFADKHVIDVGCGNFYYGWRILGAGAAEVMGVDPNILFAYQYDLVNRAVAENNSCFVPLTSQQLVPEERFDLALSLGVLYHRRSPIEHLTEMRQWLRPGGELVLETLVINGDVNQVLVPPDRYARMRNVWFIPSVAALTRWLLRSGYADVRCADVTPTTTAEQRTTQWMPFESLAEALDSRSPTQTVEGHPGPKRAILLARRR